MEQRESIQHRPTHLRDGLISFLTIFMAYGALDDITTDNGQTFVVERIMLACCAAFFVFLAVKLWREHHRLVAIISFAMIGLAAWVQPWVVRGGSPFSFLATLTALAWFLFVAVFLVSLAWRLRNSRRDSITHRPKPA